MMANDHSIVKMVLIGFVFVFSVGCVHIEISTPPADIPSEPLEEFEAAEEEETEEINPEISMPETTEPFFPGVFYAQDFDPETNIPVSFGSLECQIPNTWSVADETDFVIYFYGPAVSQLGPISLELLASETSEEDLAGEVCQQDILSAYSDLLLNTFYDLECTNMAYDELHQVFVVDFEGTIDDVYAAWRIYALVEQEDLYVFSVPFMDGDPYDYNLDVQDIISSVTALDPTSSLGVFSIDCIGFFDFNIARIGNGVFGLSSNMPLFFSGKYYKKQSHMD